LTAVGVACTLVYVHENVTVFPILKNTELCWDNGGVSMLIPPGASTGLIDTLEGAALPDAWDPDAAELCDACEVIVIRVDVEDCCCAVHR